MESKDIYQYILTEEAQWKTARVPLTGSKDWNMHEHIERCTNVANAWFHTGSNDGMRPYKDIVTPILNVAFRSEGFDVKDIVPFVNDPDNYYKSFLVKKYHPQWARNNELDTFIDDLVETSIIYDLALVKNVNNARPEVVDLQSIAFCDQTDIMAGPIGIKHQYTISELLEYKGKWNSDKIDEAIVMAKAEREATLADGQTAKTPSKYMQVYEVHGMLPDEWLRGDDYEPTSGKYTNQMHIVTYYTSTDGTKNGITLYKGKSTKIKNTFRALKIDRIKSKGRACGRSLVEQLFEPQVWTNYSEIAIKAMLDAAKLTLLQTESEEWGEQRFDNLKSNMIIKHESGKPITSIDTYPKNLVPFINHQQGQENNARVIGSASDAQVGEKPTAGLPFASLNLMVTQGEGIHEYRQGKIATFVAEQLYKDWILGYLVDTMNGGKQFSEQLTLDEMQEIGERIATNVAERKLKDMMLEGKIITEEVKQQIVQFEKEKFNKSGSRKFLKTLKGELEDIPTDVFVNISGKQKNMARNADVITNIIREIVKNPQAFAVIPGLGKIFNQLVENSGLDPIDFTQLVTQKIINPMQQIQKPEPVAV